MRRICLIILGLLQCVVALPCMCFDTLKIEETVKLELENPYGSIFSGRVIAIFNDTAIYNYRHEPTQVYTFKIQQYWKGLSGDRDLVSVYTTSSSCAAYFELDSTYLVYAASYAIDVGFLPMLYTDDCTPTKLMSKANLDLNSLGQGEIPQGTKPPLIPPDNSEPNWWLILGLSMILNVLLLYLVIRKRNIT